MMKGSRYFRHTEVNRILADPSKPRKEPGWRPTAGWTELAHMTMRQDLEAVGGVRPRA